MRNKVQKRQWSFGTPAAKTALLNTVVPIQDQGEKHSSQKTQTLPLSESSRLKEVMKKRRLDMETKKEIPIVASGVKPRPEDGKMKKSSFPHCEEIGLELDVKFKSKAGTKLDFCLLTHAVVYEIHRFINKYRFNRKSKARYASTLYEIIEHNFDLSLLNYRRRALTVYLEMRVK